MTPGARLGLHLADAGGIMVLGSSWCGFDAPALNTDCVAVADG